MQSVVTATRESQTNPLDLLEEIAHANDWPFERPNHEEMVAQIQGRWNDYRLHFCWASDVSALQFTCTLDFKVPDGRRAPVHELLVRMNERMWLGHFDLPEEDAMPVFRHTIPLRGAGGASVEQLEDLVDVALSECERFYPAFQFVIWGGKSPVQAIEAACIDTVGEA